MIFKKKPKHPAVTDKDELCIIFRKMVEAGQSIYITAAGKKLRCPLLSDEENSLFVALRADEREQAGIQAGMVIKFSLYYEGKEYYSSPGVMGTGSVQYFMAGTITVIGLETIGLHGADHFRIYLDNGKFRSLSERCLAGNLAHAAKTDDEYIALQIMCGFHTVHGNALRAGQTSVQQ